MRAVEEKIGVVTDYLNRVGVGVVQIPDARRTTTRRQRSLDHGRLDPISTDIVVAEAMMATTAGGRQT